MKSVPCGTAAARRWTLASILFLGAGLLLSACGDGGTSSPASPPTFPPPDPPAPPPPAPPPDPPTPEGIGIASFGQEFIEWSWNPSRGASGYEVQIRANAAPTDDDETIARTAGETSYRGEDLESETPYHFRVRSFAGDGGNRLVSEWSSPATGQIGRFAQAVFPETEEPSDSDLADLPPELTAKLEAFFEYVSVTAFTDRGLPDPEADPFTFGCRTTELQESLLQEWADGIIEFAFATVDLVFSLFLEDLDVLDAKIAATQAILDGMLDGFTANLSEDRCGIFHLGDAFVWQGEEDVISLTLEAPDGTTEELPDLSVIRILGTGATLDPASAPAAPTLWWIIRDDTSLGGEIEFSVFSVVPLPVHGDHRQNPY